MGSNIVELVLRGKADGLIGSGGVQHCHMQTLETDVITVSVGSSRVQHGQTGSQETNVERAR